jgi:hypothetical protein
MGKDRIDDASIDGFGLKERWKGREEREMGKRRRRRRRRGKGEEER